MTHYFALTGALGWPSAAIHATARAFKKNVRQLRFVNNVRNNFLKPSSLTFHEICQNSYLHRISNNEYFKTEV